MNKKIAIQLFGHLRTFKDTFLNFKKYLIDANKVLGYDFDIFIHTWNVKKKKKGEVGRFGMLDNSNIMGKLVSEDDKKFIIEKYNPIKLKIEEQTPDKTKRYTLDSVNKMRIDYQNQNSIDYKWILYTRPDILFVKPFVLDYFVLPYTNDEELRNIKKMPKDAMFCASNLFARIPIADPDCVTCWDLIWFNKPNDKILRNKKIPVKYFLEKDFVILRSNNIDEFKLENKKLFIQQ